MTGGGGGAFAGGGGNQVFTRIDAVNPMEPVKAFLQSKANITLSSDQEKALRPQVEAAFQQIRDLSDRAAAQRGGGQGGGERRAVAAVFRVAVVSAGGAAGVARILTVLLPCKVAPQPRS